MSDPNAATKKEEVLVMTGVRARMAAYQQEIQRKDKVPKKYAPIFKVADDLGASFHSTDGVPVRDKKPVDEGDVSMSANMDGTENEDDDENNGDVDHVFQRSMNASGRLDFSRSGDHSMTLNGNGEDDLIEEEPEKPQQVKDDEEKQAKENLGRLLGPDPEADDEKDNAEPVVLQAFSSVQRRYLKAVSKLRPQPFEFKKPEAKEAMPEAKAEIKKTLGREMDKSRHLTELTTTWDDYYEKAQDKPTEEVELQRVEEEVKQVEEEINNEWSNYAEKVVEVVVELQEQGGGDGDDNSVMSEDSDMVQWREEARRLKAEADQRKKQKADREERKKKRKQIAEIRKKRAAAAAARKKAEAEAAKDDEAAAAAKQQAEEEAKKRAEEAARKKAEEEEAARLQAEEEARAKAAEEDAKKNDSPDGSDSSESSESVDSETEKKTGGAKEKPMMEKSKSPEPPSQKKKAAADKSGGGGGDSDSDTSNENTKKTKKTKKKKDKDKEKAPKDKDGKKKKAKKAAGKKKGGGDNDDSDMEDGVPEEYPRNLDGSLWKNPLKFWTNKPKKLNEIAPKVIMRVSCSRRIVVCVFYGKP